MPYQSKRSRELRTWSHKMSSLDIQTNSSHYCYKKCIGLEMRLLILMLGLEGLKYIKENGENYWAFEKWDPEHI